MRTILLIPILMLFLLPACRKKDIYFNQLLELDSKVREMEVLNQFTSLEASRVSINYIKICKPTKHLCNDDKVELKSILSELKIDLKSFDSISSEMSNLGLLGYYFENGYSLWVEGGALGELYGYAIRHEKKHKTTTGFKVNKRYYIRIGKQVKGNLYYFKAN